jgi:formylglycine-generating enzyme required for sulfatase activity
MFKSGRNIVLVMASASAISSLIFGCDTTQVTPPQAAAPSLSWAEVLEQNPDPQIVTDADFRARMIATGLPWRVRDRGTNIEMLLVPPGTFMMGKSAGDTEAYSDEGPAHQVTLTQGFYLGRTEVTQAQWQANDQANGQVKSGRNPSYFAGYSDSPARPVEQVSWNMIQQFCTQNGLRLPTEAEWEYACRGGNLDPRYGVPNDIAWSSRNSESATHAVGGKLPNALGFYDTIGNVWEWCADYYGPYTAVDVTNPTGATSGACRVLRGGSWAYIFSFNCRVSRRYVGTADFFYVGFGFRVVRTP